MAVDFRDRHPIWAKTLEDLQNTSPLPPSGASRRMDAGCGGSDDQAKVKEETKFTSATFPSTARRQKSGPVCGDSAEHTVWFPGLLRWATFRLTPGPKGRADNVGKVTVHRPWIACHFSRAMAGCAISGKPRNLEIGKRFSWSNSPRGARQHFAGCYRRCCG